MILFFENFVACGSNFLTFIFFEEKHYFLVSQKAVCNYYIYSLVNEIFDLSNCWWS